MVDEEGGTPKGDSSQLMGLLMMFIMLMVMMNNSARMALGAALGFVFEPLIGFDHQYPFITLILAGIITTVISVAVRHHFTDWLTMARTQQINKELGAELREARLKGNQKKVEKLMAVQQKMMKEQMGASGSSMKSMAYTMPVLFGIFAWIWLFIAALPNVTFSVPWATNVNLLGRGPVLGLLPIWILVYSSFTVPFGQVIGSILKRRTFGRRLAEEAE